MKQTLRGVALVDAAVAFKAKQEKLSGMSPTAIDKIRLGDKPLSPALRRWLEKDGDMFTLGEPQSFSDMVAEEFGDDWAELFAPIAEELTEPIVLFEGWGSDSRRFLYLGETDSRGEYCVMTVDTDDAPFFCLNGPVDVWLAQQVGFLEDEEVYGSVPAEYEPARQEHARLHLNGNIAFLDGDFSKSLDPGDEDEDGDEDSVGENEDKEDEEDEEEEDEG